MADAIPGGADQPPPPEPEQPTGPTPRERIAELLGSPGAPLRRRPAIRYGLAGALGLALGYLLAAPYAQRNDSAVAALRAQAEAIRTRDDPLLKVQLKKLDDEVARREGSSGSVAVAIWVLATAAGAAAWLRLT